MGDGTNNSFAAGQTPVSAGEGFRWGQEHTPGYSDKPYDERNRLDVLRRRALIMQGGGFDPVPPDIADVAQKDAYAKRRAGGSSKSALMSAFDVTAPLGPSSILGAY